ncbi:hypothetical protein [Methylocystis heyeri]|uniref:Uncharacterized protein n=1 Tax=Methylocystis heyeri TaxID=391905 RepID=A0A6B8KHR9_9HYPH|nr:hypothetical protein [Methylocystis heyeri]QGM47207.1 hypothetical protein H2LOC_016735 [Methylocystis heyeri]
MIIKTQPHWKPDKTAERILFAKFWSRQGWTYGRISPDDYDYAKYAGYLFDRIKFTHDELIDELLAVRDRLDPTLVAQAFSDSLTTRRLDLRSALGSFGAVLRLQKHDIDARPIWNGCRCDICQLSCPDEEEDINVLSFERFKWGGVRHDDPLYELLDLSPFEAADRDSSRQSREPLLRILDIAGNAPADCSPNQLLKLIAPFVPGNASERRIALQCLGYVGILQPTSHPGFFDGYPTMRQHPGKGDWSYPFAWWRGSDGVNAKALEFYFPGVKM